MSLTSCKLGDLISISKGRKAAEVLDTPTATSKRYIQINDLRTDEKIIYAEDPSGVEVVSSDICIAWDGANAGTVGYGLSGYIGSTIARLRAKSCAQFFSPYVGRFLQTKFSYLNGGTTGATIPHVSKDKLLDLEIPLPPLDEQRRIAAILDKTDAIRRKRQESIRLTEEFIRSTFLEMFGDPVTNPKGWKVKPLENLVNFTTGKLDSNAAIPGGAYPFFTCAREDFQIDTYAFDCEALLLAGNNASADYSVKHYKGKFNAYQRTYVITLARPDLTYRYMQYALEMKLQDMKRLSKGTNTKYLTLGILNQLQFQVPDKALQIKFESVKDTLAEHIITQNKSLELANSVFESCVYRAFRGKL